MPPLAPRHRLSRRELRRRQVRRNIAWVASLLVILWAFGAGYLWRQIKTRDASLALAPQPVSEEQRVEALGAIDEAVRARFEERWQGAVNAVAAARRADPQVRGVDVFIGEVALEQKDPETLRRATERALQTGENEVSAKLLRAVETWMRRGEKGTDRAGALARQYLFEAAESEPSSAAVPFFHGELSRLLGDSAEAQRQLRSALYRQQSWRSSFILESKMQLAAREASVAGKSAPAGAPGAQVGSLLALLNAVGSGAPTDLAQTEFWASVPVLQALALLDDAAFAGLVTRDSASEAREKLTSIVPHLHARD